MSIDGLYNFRDLGGLPLVSGGTTRPGVLYRSAALDGLTAQGEREFAATRVGVVVDLRTATERSTAPDRLPDDRPFTSASLPLLEGAIGGADQNLLGANAPSSEDLAAAMAALPSLDDLYIRMLRNGGTTFAEVARLLASSRDDIPTAVLVHCTAGKDRTGVAIALLLDAAGVERSAIVADYAVSERNLAGPWAKRMLGSLTSMGVPVTPALTTLVTGTPPEAIESALAWIEREHSDSAGYLLASGLDESDLVAMQARLRG